MKNNPTVLNSITNDHATSVGVVVHAEWPMNRYYRTVVDNTPSEDDEGYDIELFPIESITKPNRPTAGICKAVVGQATVEPRYRNTPPSARFYTCDRDDEYKYWQSPYTSDSTTFVMADCAPEVTYVEEDDVAGVPVPLTVNVNKITFTIETAYAKPTEYDVQVKYTTDGAWTTVASNVAIPSTGRVNLWWNGTDWTTTKDLTESVDVSAVRLVVNKMNKSAFFNLIELGVCLERDLSADVEGFDDTFDMGEKDFITPLGTISSNTGRVSLFNGDEGRYSNTNQASEFYGILDKGVLFRCWMKYGSEQVQEFEMLSDDWEETETTTTVSLVDYSKIFMDTKPRAVLYQDIPIQEAVWRICDIVGFTKFNVTTLDTSKQAMIDIFWTDGEKTAWETLSELARATQTAIYFDSTGTLQVKTRDTAWDNTKPEAYTFLRESVPGGQPSNIVSLNETAEYEANKVKVNWNPTSFSERRDNVVPFEVVWEPEGNVILRATPLARNLMIGENSVFLQRREGKTWPWKGMMQIEGEWIAFEGKRYVYYDENDQRQSTWINDFESQQKLDEKSGSFYRHMNHYTGQLRITERGLFNTEEKNHVIDLRHWTKTRRKNYSNNHSPTPGIKLDINRSEVDIKGGRKLDMNDYTYLHHGNVIDQGYKYIGARMKINKSADKDKIGGIFFNADGGVGSGYYLEVTATKRMNGNMRKSRNEVIFYSMKPDGSKKVIGGRSVRLKNKSQSNQRGAVIKRDVGARLAVPQNRFIDFDIWYNNSGTNDVIQVFANGDFLFEAVVEGGSGWKHSKVGLTGIYARGNSSVTFDYFYAINSTGIDQTDNESYFDRIEGGWRGNQIEKDWTYETRRVRRKVRRRWKKRKQRYQQRFYEEFGPIAHEVREFKVKFTSDTPVLESKLYFSNTTQAVCTEYVGDTSGATFVMANIRREPAVINGDDERTAMGNGTINHKLFVYGRPVIQKDAEAIEKVDEWAIRRRGPIEVEYDSPWIQNEAEAESFANWLTTHWSRSDTTLEVEVFGNPLVELTDVVHVKWKHIDDLFYVTGITNNYSQGLSTNLTLRKVTI